MVYEFSSLIFQILWIPQELVLSFPDSISITQYSKNWVWVVKTENNVLMFSSDENWVLVKFCKLSKWVGTTHMTSLITIRLYAKISWPQSLSLTYALSPFLLHFFLLHSSLSSSNLHYSSTNLQSPLPQATSTSYYEVALTLRPHRLKSLNSSST